MEEIDILLAVAEIAVVLAGFASLATVIRHEYTSTDPQVNSLRLRALLDIAVSTMLLALIAVLVLKVEWLNTWVWRGSSIVGLLLFVPVSLAAHKRSKLRRNLPGYNKPAALIIYSILVAVFVCFVINSAGLTGKFGFHVFLGTLILMLAACSIYFVVFVISLLDPVPEPGPTTEK